jgi:hypothetical protein
LEKAFRKDLLEAYPKPKPTPQPSLLLLKNDRQAICGQHEFGNSNIIPSKPIISRNTSTDWLVISIIRRHNSHLLYHGNQFVANGTKDLKKIMWWKKF